MLAKIGATKFPSLLMRKSVNLPNQGSNRREVKTQHKIELKTMALIKCPECGKEISDKALRCPHCGFELNTHSSNNEPDSHKKWLLLIIGFIIMAMIALLLFVFRGHSEKTTNLKEKTAIVKENFKQEQNTIENTKKERSFLSQDLKMYCLFGPVKEFSIIITDCNADGSSTGTKPHEDLLRLQYKRDGHFVKKIDESFTVNDVTSIDGDRIMEAKIHMQDFDIDISKQWQYYPNGLTQQCILEGLENHAKCVYYYDNHDELLKMEVYSTAEGTNTKTTITYSIEERDGYYNWTRRMAEVAEQEYVAYYDGREEYFPATIRYEKHNRTIRYFDQESSQQNITTSSPHYVVINGTELRLRISPSPNGDTFKWKDGSNRHPNKGEKYRYLGESGDFYKIDYKGNELWVSKQYTYLE